LAELRDLYDLPFAVNTRHATALVVGAGTGNDVQAALRNGYQGVTSVDIDGRIIAIGRAQHPEQPYSVPGVRTVVDDARSFFEKSRDEKYDVVCYGLLDSHAMSSAMSTLRLDNYVYTEEGIRAAWNHVAQGGHLSLAISCGAGPWFFERLFWTITRATGREPLAFVNRLHGLTMTFVVPREGAAFVASEVGKRTRVRPITTIDRTLTTSDDWPFLYIRPGIFPWGYLIVIGVLLVVATVSVRRVFDFGRGGATEFDWPLFLMGAAFLLIETRGVTSMSLLFGSTWVVNSAVFTGILLMVLAANLAVDRWRVASTTPWFCALFAAVALLYVFPVAWLHTLPIVARGLVGGLLTGLPVGCAGVIVSALLARSAQPVSALGANLLGAVLGGCLEYYSMIGGLRSTALLALVLYLCAFLAVRKSRRAPTGAAIAAAAVA
jgi:SAM-dependent methyltransferase